MKGKRLTDEERIERKEKEKERARERNLRRMEQRRADPELRARIVARQRANRQKLMSCPVYAAKEREKARIRAKKRQEKDPEKNRESCRRYKRENLEKVRAQAREYSRKNPLSPERREERRIYMAEYRSKPEVKAKKRIWAREDAARKRKSPVYRTFIAIRSRTRKICKLLGLGSVPKGNKTRFVDYFGAEPSVVLAHIESQFRDGMSWENCGSVWHYDHIIPLCRGLGNIELLTKLNHYKNLRPLLKAENLQKGDKMPDFFPDGVPFAAEEVGWSPPPIDERGPVEVAV